MKWYFSIMLFVICINQWRTSEACSCQMKHPQQHYCEADFVILAVPKYMNNTKSDISYKLKIRNQFKMTEKAQVALKAGRIKTPEIESMCSVNLELNQLYIITGHIVNLEANINLCNSYVKLWKNTGQRQRKGFKLLYKGGCQCKIRECSNATKCANLPPKANTCKWLNPFNKPRCQLEYGICTPRNGTCKWAMARNLTRCLRSQDLSPIR